jgi:4-amino-4-deoxy-L-arabinose transferase-like glycosyltransferase/membrane-associated phospholipid phosphatase
MQWAQSVDTGLFHLVNPAWSCPFLDVVMPFFSGNALFVPALLVTGFLLIWKGGPRGRILLVMMLLVFAFGDGVINHLKHLIGRPRPFLTLAGVHMPTSIGRTSSGSMPSAHAANCFAAAMVALIYYRRTIYWTLPLATIVAISRVYNGVHYPSDILAGAILGSGYAAGLVWTADALWRWAGQRWFPLWWQRLPSTLNPVVQPSRPETDADKTLRDRQWIRLGYVVIFAQLIINLIYIASGVITLSEDEAYQWIWSKHLALSYYSKPPLIALTQWLGTHLWGDTVFGVRFFAPVLGAITSICLLRFMAKVTNARAAFWLVAIMSAVPLISVGSTLMTIDPLSVTFWVLAMIAGWKAVQDDATTHDWFWVGLWMGLGFLSKYTALFQLLSWVLFFAVYPPARKQLRRVGPYLALFVNFICSIPVLMWNSENHWITIKHVREGGNLDQPFLQTMTEMVNPANLWNSFKHYTLDFLGAEFALQNPFFFPVLIFTAIIIWRQKPKSPLLVYFFSMVAPIFLTYFLLTFHSRVLPNWIAPCIPPFFCLAVAYWEARWRDGAKPLKFVLVAGMIFGIAASVILRDTNLVAKLGGNSMMDALETLPNGKQRAEDLRWKLAALDSTRRVKGWEETAQLVEAAREKLQTEGKPVFLIGDHYGITGELTFNIAEARTNLPDKPLVYFHSSTNALNQFYFWPGYLDRKGQNALFLREVDLTTTNTSNIPDLMKNEFESVTNIGTVLAIHKGRPTHRIEIIECRGLR